MSNNTSLLHQSIDLAQHYCFEATSAGYLQLPVVQLVALVPLSRHHHHTRHLVCCRQFCQQGLPLCCHFLPISSPSSQLPAQVVHLPPHHNRQQGAEQATLAQHSTAQPSSAGDRHRQRMRLANQVTCNGGGVLGALTDLEGRCLLMNIQHKHHGQQASAACLSRSVAMAAQEFSHHMAAG
jgi:hypothetical protein